MKYPLSLISSLFLLASTTPSGWAQATRPIPISAARGEQQIVTIEVYPGQGVTLNFRPTGDIVRRAWIDDPSQVTLDFDDPGCMGVGEPGSCAAQVIHLRRIQGLEFPELPSTGTTTLTVLSDAELYTFRLNFPDSGSPAYSILAIQPEPEPQIAPRLVNRQPTIQQIEQGLQVAQTRKLIAPEEPLWDRIQTLLQLMREGISTTEAARQAGVSQRLVARLAELGTGG